MPEDPNAAPDLSQFTQGLSAPIPQVPPSQPPLQPPTQSGRTPNTLEFIRQMVNPTAHVQPGDIQPRPPTRLGAFESFLGNFLQSFASGMSQSGGPGQGGRAFGAAQQAPYQAELQQYGLQQQAQQNQSLEQERQSQAQYRAAQAAQLQDQVTLPNGMTVPAAVAKILMPAQVANINQTGQNQRTAMTQAGATQRTGLTTDTQKAIANQNTQQKYQQFQQTQDYLKWKTNQDNATKKSIAQLNAQTSQGKAPAALIQSAVFAKGGMKSFGDARSDMDKLEQLGVMGSLPANKVEDWIFGKGLVDPNLPPEVRKTIGHMRAAISLGSSAMLRAHTGRTSKEIYDDFKQLYGPGQDWSALRGAMNEADSILTDYANAPSDASMNAIRQGNSSAPSAAKESKTYNGATYERAAPGAPWIKVNAPK